MLATTSNGSVDTGSNRHEPPAGVARLLVMGAERVGKSAAIVRFTTGRFIHQYCPSTQDWLYRHQLLSSHQRQDDPDLENEPPVQIELLEQKMDSQTTTSDNEDVQRKRERNCSPPSSLALRVASDQRADRELRECHQLLGKLQWANAYVIVYSLTNSNSFDKAREYLDLLDWMYSMNSNQEADIRNPESMTSKVSQRLKSHRAACITQLSPCQQRPPILLLGNKHDLASNCPGTRQVTLEQGHELAVAHKCLFAELSISECANSIRSVLLELVGRALLAPSAVQTITKHSSAYGPTHLIKWQPSHLLISTRKQQPAWSSLIKTQMPLVSSSHSTQVAGARPSRGLAVHEVAAAATTYSHPIAVATCTPLKTTIPGYAAGQLVGEVQCTTAAPVMPGQPSAQSSLRSSPTNASRYGALKSTFKKASLAIVSGKALASRVSGRSSTGDASHQQPPVTALKRNSTTSSNLSELVGSEPAFSIRGSIGSLSSSSTTAATAVPAVNSESPPSKLNKSSNWIKSRFSRQESSGSEDKSSQSAIVSNTCESQQACKEQAPGGKFRRPLFKYKNRLKTVAFEPSFSSSSCKAAGYNSSTTKQSSESIRTITTNSLGASTGTQNQQQQQQQQQQNRASGTTSPLSSISSSSRSSAHLPDVAYNLNRCSSGRSSSSLSTSDTYYSSLFVVCQARASGDNQTPGRSPSSTSASPSSCRQAPTPSGRGGNQRQDSRSTLSRASTSVGSYDEMLEEMEIAAGECVPPPPPAAATPSSRKISADKPPVGAAPTSLRTRFQVVKTVQSTLTNLAKSTRATVTPAQPVKRSFCSALMSTSMSLASPRVCETAATMAPIQQVAKIEPIHTIPAVIGYCK